MFRPCDHFVRREPRPDPQRPTRVTIANARVRTVPFPSAVARWARSVVGRTFAIGALTLALAACGASESDGVPAVVTNGVKGGVTDGVPAPDNSDDEPPYRVVVDEDGVGESSAMVVFDDAEEFDLWWNELGFAGSTPLFEPAKELVIGITATYPSGCQFGFRDIRINESERTVEARYLGNEPAATCGSDANPFTVVAAIERSALAGGSWEATMSVADVTTSFEVP